MRILIVDDQRSAQRVLTSFLQQVGDVEITNVANKRDALEILNERPIDVAFVDLRLSDQHQNRDGLHLVEHMVRTSTAVPIVVSAFSDIHDVRQAMRAGAHDYVLKDELCPELLRPILERLGSRWKLERELRALRSRGRGPNGLHRLIGNSAPMLRLRAQLERVALSDRPVLVRGPSGTGKELVVEALHSLGSSPDEPLLDINCGALPENLVEAQLFGYEKGAFTGATTRNEGYFAAVGQGTLFLDEIGELPYPLQAKLLRVLESNRYRPLGAAADREFRGRLIAATHVDLEEATKKRGFREDLFYRLNVLTVFVPELEERREDIPLLIAHFLSRQGRPLRLTEGAVRWLSEKTWPGNVRELRNAIDRIVVFAEEDTVSEAELESILGGPRPLGNELEQLAARLLQLDLTGDKLNAVRQAMIQIAIAQSHGNKTHAAARLGVHRKVIERGAKE